MEMETTESFSVTARLSKEWKRRMIIIAVVVWGTSAYFLYDGAIGWPKKQKIYEAYAALMETLIAEGEARDERDPEALLAWRELAKENNWAQDIPKEYPPEKIEGQFHWAAATAVGGVGFLIWFFWHFPKTIRADGEKIYGVRGQVLPFDQITEVDRKRWKREGIAYARFEKDGKPAKLMLDDYKYAGAEDIIKEAERRLGIEYVENPEVEPGSKNEASDDETSSESSDQASAESEEKS